MKNFFDRSPLKELTLKELRLFLYLCSKVHNQCYLYPIKLMTNWKEISRTSAYKSLVAKGLISIYDPEDVIYTVQPIIYYKLNTSYGNNDLLTLRYNNLSAHKGDMDLTMPFREKVKEYLANDNL